MNAQRNSNRRKYRKIWESTKGQGDTSINRDENKNQVEHIDVKRSKELAEKVHKVDEKISRNSHLIFERCNFTQTFLDWEDPCWYNYT